MIAASDIDFQYSTDVDMWLECPESDRIPLMQVGSTFIIAASPRNIAACEATVVVTVNGKYFHRAVHLVAGMSADSAETMILSRDDVSPF